MNDRGLEGLIWNPWPIRVANDSEWLIQGLVKWFIMIPFWSIAEVAIWGCHYGLVLLYDPSLTIHDFGCPYQSTRCITSKDFVNWYQRKMHQHPYAHFSLVQDSLYLWYWYLTYTSQILTMMVMIHHKPLLLVQQWLSVKVVINKQQPNWSMIMMVNVSDSIRTNYFWSMM